LVDGESSGDFDEDVIEEDVASYFDYDISGSWLGETMCVIINDLE